MPDWQFNTVPSAGGAEIPLTATSRSVQFKLGPGDYTQGSMTLDGRSPTAALMSELVSDVLIRCDGSLLARCVLNGGTATLDGTSHVWQVEFVDYRGRLDRIPLEDSDADLVRIITLAGDPVGGTYTLTYGGHTTATLGATSPAAVVQGVLAALPNVGNHVAVAGDNGGPYTATFDTTVVAAKLTATNALVTGTQGIKVVGSPTGGTFRLSYAGATTGALAFNISASDLSDALAALSTVGGPNAVSVAGGDGGQYTVTFTAPKVAAVLAMAANAMTGGTFPTVKISAQATSVGITAGTTDAVTITNTDAGDIPRLLINTAATYPGGNLGIAAAQNPGPHVGSHTAQVFQVDQTVMSAIDQTAQQLPGFEWDIDTAKKLQIYPQGRGYDRTSQQWVNGSQFVTVIREFDPSQYGNRVRAQGGTTPAGVQLAPAIAAASDLATRPEGLYGISASDQDITSPTVLNQYALWELDQSADLPVTYTCTLKPGLWQGPQTLWLGDTVTLVVQDGRLNISTPARCVEIDVTLGDDGSETIQAVFGRPRIPFYKRLGRVLKAISTLERHT